MDRVRAEAIRTLYAQMGTTARSNVVITLYMAGVSWPFTPWPIVLGWAAMPVVNQVLRWLLVRAFDRHKPRDAGLGRWARAYIAHQALVGATWGATMVLFAHTDQPVTVALTLCCLYSIGAGGVPAQAYYPPSFLALVSVLFGCIFVRLVATGEWGWVLLGSASALFGVAMAGFCRTQNRAVMDSFRIRFENQDLVEALQVQKAAAEDARRRAELASLAKSQFLAAASHDLRQPLYALTLFSASLDTLRLDAGGRRVVGNIQNSIAVMESLFEGLLDLSKLEAGVVQPHLVPVPVDAAFDRLSQVFRPIAMAKGLDLRFRSDGEWVFSDPVLLEQVLSNLLSNALRCTVAGGVLVAARRRAGAVRLEVWDTGIGIADADRGRIFEEFVQLGNPERDRRKGLGLGLSIARHAAALIGARIAVSSRVGRGSCFGFAQATAAPAAPVRPVPAMEPARARPGLPVLIVDDEASVRDALADLLERWGVARHMVADGAAALRAVEAGGRYGFVLCDYRLPGALNGLQVIERIRGCHPAPVPEVALITADFDPALLAAARAAGVRLLHKPLHASRLAELVGHSVPDRTVAAPA